MYKPVFAPRRFCKYSETAPNTIIAEGTYRGPVEGTYGLQHVIVESNGTEVILNKAGHLDFLLQRAGVGANVQVVYMGEGIVTKGKFKGKKTHQFNVLIADATNNTTQE